MRHPVPVLLLPLAVACSLWVGCADTANHRQAPTAPLSVPAGADKPLDFPGLHNVVNYAAEVYSGGAPDGDAGFASLSALGIKTVLSVDGTLPEVDKALAHGLHYVHLPIGYDGVPQQRGLEIAAVIARMQKPIYIHCHHGKHRSASAAATGCVIDGLLSPEEAVARMHVSGTAAEYEGLYASARNASSLPLEQLPLHPEQFPSSNVVSGTVAVMTAVDNVFDELKTVRGEQWQVPKSHPDLVPAHAAKELHELLAGLANDNECQQQPADFHRFLQQSIAAAAEFQLALEAHDTARSESAYTALNQSCKQCHKQFRDRR